MPFDATATTVVLPPSSDERWSVRRNATPGPRIGWSPSATACRLLRPPRRAIPLVQALQRRRQTLRRRQFSDKCEPMTVISKQRSPQSQRLLARLHDALPRYAQRPTQNPAYVLAKYNDEHGNPAIVRVAERAYRSSLVDGAKERKEMAASR